MIIKGILFKGYLGGKAHFDNVWVTSMRTWAHLPERMKKRAGHIGAHSKPSTGEMETAGFVRLTDYPGWLLGDSQQVKDADVYRSGHHGRTSSKVVLWPLYTYAHPPRETCALPCYTQHTNEMS